MRKRAFTLTELLIALGIIGTIAALCIPSLMTTINNKSLAIQLQNNVASVQQAIANQKIIKNTKDLTETAFANETDFMPFSNRQKVKHVRHLQLQSAGGIPIELSVVEIFHSQKKLLLQPQFV